MIASHLSKALWVVCVVLGLHAKARAEPIDLQSIPGVLLPWIPWALDDSGEAPCPRLNELSICVWPSALSLDADDRGATFTLAASTDRRALVTLPGSAEHWPTDVRLGIQPLVVIEPGGAPQVWLPAGSHVLAGRFAWRALPDALQVPPDLGMLSLELNGERIATPRRDATGLVWLAQGRGREAEAERLELSVHRRIDDGVPLRVTTRIQVSAAGTGREVVLPRVLVEGTRAIELRAELPAQLLADGSLRLQAQAGSYRVEIVAIIEQPVEVLRAPQAESPWPAQEYWVFAADNALRHLELPSVGQIDASRTDLATDWHNLQTFVVPPGGALALTTRRRGEAEPAPNQLSLERSLWLDLDGWGYTVRDELRGSMHRDFRLDLRAGVLGRARVDGKDELVTQRGTYSGIELRRSAVQLSAEWRLEGAKRDLPAVGWSEDVQSLEMHLHLPPGFVLLGAQGVDHIPDTWLGHWDLWGFFLVLLVALAVGKLAGAAWGILSLFTLVLSHHEPDAPATVWLAFVAATALSRVVTDPRWVKAARFVWGLGLLSLLLVVLPFSVAQIRKALYPQVDPSGNSAAPTQFADMVLTDDKADGAGMGREEGTSSDASEAPESEPPGAVRLATKGGEGASRVTQALGEAVRPKQKQAYHGYDRNDVDPHAVVQTGPGLPTWSWRQIRMAWSGPVQRGQRIKLWLVPPPAMRVWSLLTVLLNFGLLAALSRAAQRSLLPSIPGTAYFLLVLSALGGAPARAQAPRPLETLPSEAMLDTLRQRLLRPADCEPSCLSVPALWLNAEGSRIVVRAEVHAGARTVYTAPGPLESWAPDSITVDGKPALAVVRLDDGFLHLRVPEGRHTVVVSGTLPASPTLTLSLGSPPHHVDAKAPGFVIEGLSSDGRPQGSLVLRREVALEPSAGGAARTLMPWLDVKRSFDLGVRFRVVTTVRRLGPAADSMLVRLPLLPGESVTQAGLSSERGGVVIELARDQTELTFASTLPDMRSIALVAAQPTQPGSDEVLHPWNETWQVTCAALLHCEFDGLTPVVRLSDGVFQPFYRPWPGEKLTVHTQRLAGTHGSSLTIDRALLELTPGIRIERGVISLNARTSRGSTQHITLPPGATLTSLLVDGAARTARVKAQGVELHLDPGAHNVELAFQRAASIGPHYQSPRVRVGQALTNVTTTLHVPQGRWLLWVVGPSWGPAILFWGYLALVILVAWGLSRVPESPLALHEWVLLGLGLTQVEAAVGLVVVGWFFAIAYRARYTLPARWAFNLGQVGLVLFTALALACLASAVHQGLVVQPDMQVQGMNSSNDALNWYLDRTGGGFPVVGFFSLPLWTYKGVMLAWALWLAASLLRWLARALDAFRRDGAWRSAVRTSRAPPGKLANPKEAMAGTDPSATSKGTE